MKLKLILSKNFERFPLMAALVAQLISLLFIKIGIQIFHYNLSTFAFVFLQATFSVFIGQVIFKLPKWFFLISILFPVLIVLAFNYLRIHSSIYGLLFLFFALTFSHTLKERVPLYLTNKKTHEALRNIIAERKAKSFLDLGSGLGGVVRAVAGSNINSVGVESAPLLWGLSSFTSIILFQGKILRKNIWDTNLSDYEIVYAFLSPAIMSKLFLKIKNEMLPGSLFVSNSFAIEGVEASEIWELSDQRKTRLYFYKI